MWTYMKRSFLNNLLILLLISSQLPALQRSPNFNSSTSSSQEPTPSTSNVDEELAGNMQPRSVSTNPPVVEEEEEDEHERSVPENYLYTGDASLLSSSHCSKSFQLTPQHGAIPQYIKDLLYQSTMSLTNTANFLNLIFQASDLRETSVREDIEWYHALIRSLLVGERPNLVRNALLSFNADPTTPQPQLVLWGSKGSSQDIYLQDLTKGKPHSLSHGLNQSWFKSLNSNNPSFPGLSKQILRNDLSTLETPKWAHGGTYVTNSSGLQWGEAPLLECMEGRFLPGWLLTLSMPFYGLKPDLNPELRGVIRLDVNIQEFDVNQCATGKFWFSDTHRCNRTSMECEQIPGQGFRLGQYCCRCKEGYYSFPALPEDQIEGSRSTHGCYPQIPVCVPCWPGCKQCQDGSPCWVEEDWNLRAVLLVVHGFFMALVLIGMLGVYQCRRTRPIRASGLLLLEIILVGSLLLYFPVLIMFFKPSTFRCILLRWLRLLGFIGVYGTVTLKTYRVLNVFLSCTAQRVPDMSVTSLLRMLGVMVLTVTWFLCAWSMGVLQNQDRNIPVLIKLTTWDGQKFRACDLDRWDYMMALAELLFLCWSSSVSGAVKAVPSASHEPRYMFIAVRNELLFSTAFHLLRFTKPSLHPDWTLLLFFIHVHVTITATLGLLFFPKFLRISQLIKDDVASEMYEDEAERRRSPLHLNNSFTSACWSDHNLDPDDIRGELKKLYTQLEIHKTKKMEKRNPHLRKKRSSGIAFGRSLIRRIAEIPDSTSRQSSNKDKEVPGAAGGTPKGSGSLSVTSESTRVDKRNEAAKSPEVSSETESMDAAPIFYKSISAQNLAVDENFLQPVSVQKSLSFTETHSDHYSQKSTSHAFQTHLKETEVENKPNLKHARSLSEERSRTKLYVCPWEFASSSSSPYSSPAVGKIKTDPDLDVESSRPKAPISSSAPVSPYTVTKPMARYGLSFRSATQTLLQAKGTVEKKGRNKYSGKNRLIGEKGSIQRGGSAGATQTAKRPINRDDSKPRLVKQAAIRFAPDRTSVRNAPSRIRPRDAEYENRTPGQKRTRSGRASSSVPRSAGRHRDVLQSNMADICPWEVTAHEQTQSDRGTTSELCDEHKASQKSSWESLASRIDSKAKEGIAQHHADAESFPGDPHESVSEATNATERVVSVNPRRNPVRQKTLRTDVCPWETCNTQTNHEVRRDVSWESGCILGKYSERIENTDSKRLTRTVPHGEICPWDFLETSSCQGESENPENPSAIATKQPTSTAETCPWDFPEHSQEAEVSQRSEGMIVTKDTVLEKGSVNAKTSLRENIRIESESSRKRTGLRVNADDLRKQGNENDDDVHPQGTKEKRPNSDRNDLEVHISPWVSETTAQAAKTNRPPARRDALPPCEMKGGSKATVTEPDNNSDIFAWEELIAEEESDAETAAEAFIFPPDLQHRRCDQTASNPQSH